MASNCSNRFALRLETVGITAVVAFVGNIVVTAVDRAIVIAVVSAIADFDNCWSNFG